MNELAGILNAQTAPVAYSGTCQVWLSGLEVMADIGVWSVEHGVLQPLIVDVALTIVPPSQDVLDQTFDYDRVRLYAGQLATRRTALIETFAHDLAALCLQHSCVLAAEVHVAKPQAVPGCLAATRVRLDASGA